MSEQHDQLIDQREPGFFIVDDEVIDEYGAKIGMLGVAVYNVLARHANHHGKNSFPSYQTIADKLSISRKTAIKGVEILVKHKLVKKEPRTDAAGDAASNIYKILPVKGKGKRPEKVVQDLHHPEEFIRPGGVTETPPSADATPPLVQIMDQGGVDITPEPDTLNQTPLNQTHTPARAAPASGNGVGVSKSRFTFEERKLYAENNTDHRGQKLGPGWLQKSRDGSSDELIETWFRARATGTVAAEPRDITLCPDCGGSNFTPSVTGSGVVKCFHPRLDEVIEHHQREYERAREELTAQ